MISQSCRPKGTGLALSVRRASGVPSVIEILESNRDMKEDLVATGILPVILDRLAGSLSYHSVLSSDPIRYGYKTFKKCYNLAQTDHDQF